MFRKGKGSQISTASQNAVHVGRRPCRASRPGRSASAKSGVHAHSTIACTRIVSLMRAWSAIASGSPSAQRGPEPLPVGADRLGDHLPDGPRLRRQRRRQLRHRRACSISSGTLAARAERAPRRSASAPGPARRRRSRPRGARAPARRPVRRRAAHRTPPSPRPRRRRRRRPGPVVAIGRTCASGSTSARSGEQRGVRLDPVDARKRRRRIEHVGVHRLGAEDESRRLERLRAGDPDVQERRRPRAGQRRRGRER